MTSINLEHLGTIGMPHWNPFRCQAFEERGDHRPAGLGPHRPSAGGSGAGGAEERHGGLGIRKRQGSGAHQWHSSCTLAIFSLLK